MATEKIKSQREREDELRLDLLADLQKWLAEKYGGADKVFKVAPPKGGSKASFSWACVTKDSAKQDRCIRVSVDIPRGTHDSGKGYKPYKVAEDFRAQLALDEEETDEEDFPL